MEAQARAEAAVAGGARLSRKQMAVFLALLVDV
jgi:hypothetical protein